MVATPYDADTLIGYFRIMNHKIFAQYMNDRYYDEVFYAPKDRRKREKVEVLRPSRRVQLGFLGRCHRVAFLLPRRDDRPDVAAGERCQAGTFVENPTQMCDPATSRVATSPRRSAWRRTRTSSFAAGSTSGFRTTPMS